MKAKAQVRYLRVSPRKVRMVADALRGLNVQEALNQLALVNKRAAQSLTKLINSAVANAENNFSLDKNTLRIDELRVDDGPILKRYRPKGFGRVSPIKRRTSHVLVRLEGERLTQKAKPAKKKPEMLETAEQKGISPRGEAEKPKSPPTERTAKHDFELVRKVGQERKPSFVKRIFRRKSI